MRSSALNIIFFFVYVLVQVLILKNLVLFDVAFCFLYVAFILLLPVEMSPVALMFTAFGMGFLVDIFYSSMGLHAFALVITAYARNYWLMARAGSWFIPSH
jgi:rod shape-determining protein MreD